MNFSVVAKISSFLPRKTIQPNLSTPDESKSYKDTQSNRNLSQMNSYLQDNMRLENYK